MKKRLSIKRFPRNSRLSTALIIFSRDQRLDTMDSNYYEGVRPSLNKVLVIADFMTIAVVYNVFSTTCAQSHLLALPIKNCN